MSSPAVPPAPRPFALPAGPWVGFVAVLVLFTALIGIKGELGTFLRLGNLRVLLHEGTVPAVVALVTVVTMRVYTALYQPSGPSPAASLAAVAAGVGVGGLCGLTNGLLV